jgi:hypothetical protein
MNKTVIVVTSTELGWDCIVGVYQGVALEDLEASYKGDCYVFTERDIETTRPDLDD